MQMAGRNWRGADHISSHSPACQVPTAASKLSFSRANVVLEMRTNERTWHGAELEQKHLICFALDWTPAPCQSVSSVEFEMHKTMRWGWSSASVLSQLLSTARPPQLFRRRVVYAIHFCTVMAPTVPTLKTATGLEIPVFGLGTWKSAPGEVTQTVKDAIDVGYRHIDCALVYGNEAEVGSAIQAKITEGVVKREDLFLVSKLWNTFHSSEKVVPSLKKTLKDLGTDYVDLYLIHWPMGFKEDEDLFPKGDDDKIVFSDVDFLDAWKGMEEAYKLGLAKNIGLSNFNHEQIERIFANSTVRPTVLQVECHPYLNQNKLIEFCRSNNILVTCYSPLGSADRPWAKPDDVKLLDDPRITEIGKKYGKSPAQVVLRWQVQRGLIVIPKTVKKERLIENLNIFDFSLSPEDVALINSFDCNGRVCHLSWNSHHKHFPFNIEY